MRAHRRFAVGIAIVWGLTLGAGAPARAQDFDPRGRHKPRPAAPSGTPKPRAPSGPASAPRGDGAPASVLIERYTKVALAQPGAPFPLQRLAQLYRDRDGKLSALVADFEARAAQSGPEQYAATVTLAGIYKLDGRADEAVATYEKAAALRPNDPAALLALARVLQDRGDLAAARPRYEQALALQTLPADREQTLRTLMGLALEAKDYAGAKAFHAQLVKMQPNSLFVRGELGRELYARGEYEKAEAELKDLVNAAQGDNRALAPALKDLGRAQAKAHEQQAALATLKRALVAAGSEAAVRAEIYETITEIYRADQQLPVLIKQIEDEHPTDFARLSLLGSLYEETGDAANALATYRKALAVNPRQIDLRLKMVRLLQSQGELDKAIAEYEALIRAAPNNPQFVFEECEALLQRGDRARALQLLTALEARAGGDEEVLSRVADFYGRIGEGDRSLKVLTRLAQVGAGDPSHLVDLGDRYFQDGNVPLAVQTWRRILVTVQPRARALSALGDVYLEHDMTADALTAVREAVQLEPANPAYKKQLAGALERARSYREARGLWQEIAEKAKATNDRALAREARTHLVTLWGLERTLEQQVGPLTAQFNAQPPDVDAGRTLAEVLTHLRRLDAAEATQRRIIELAPGDAETYLALERTLVQENKLADAIAVLEKLVAVDPKRARELYQRMAQYAMQLYKDEDAIRYAVRAVELNPDDAEGHRRLGEMYRSRQDVDHAITEFRAAIAKNDRLYIVYFELADLLLSKGEPEEADRLFRRVVRGAPDEELVSRAARLSMQINLGRGTLESLEQELVPLAIGNPQRTIYRKLLVEIYGSLTFGLVQRVKHGTGKDAEAARAALSRIGARAVKPLLDALADGDAGQQRIAIDVLGFVQNKNAGPALFAFAAPSGGNPAETPLRTRAMVACGALRDPTLLPKYEGFLLPKPQSPGADEGMPTDTVAVAATWGLARLGDKRALPALRALMKRGTPPIRALAVLGIGVLHDRSAIPDVTALAKAPDAGNVARAASAYVLGALGAESERATLLMLADGNDALPRQMALVALADLAGHAKDRELERAATSAMADAVFAGSEAESTRARLSADALRRAGSGGLMLLAAHGTGTAAEWQAREMLPVPDEAIDVEQVLEQLVPAGFTPKEQAAAFVVYAPAIEQAARSALQTSSDRARAVLDAMSGGDGVFEPFVHAGDTSPETQAARARASVMARALEPSVIALARHPDPQMRTKVIVLLARSPTPAATQAVVQAVGDPNEAVQRVALAAIGAQADPRTVGAVGQVLATNDAWPMRVLAAQALGRLGGAEGGRGAHDATPLLQTAAHRDPYALVREAALVALARYDAAAARATARDLAAADPEPRVRDVAARIASGAPPARAPGE